MTAADVVWASQRLSRLSDAQWHDAFGVVTRGRVQLELRDGEPGPVLGRDAGFWLRGTGVRALRNAGVLEGFPA